MKLSFIDIYTESRGTDLLFMRVGLGSSCFFRTGSGSTPLGSAIVYTVSI